MGSSGLPGVGIWGYRGLGSRNLGFRGLGLRDLGFRS